MNLENNTPTGSTESTDGAPVTKPARRRAVRKAAPAAVTLPIEIELPNRDVAASDAVATTDVEPAAPVKATRSRRATRTSSAASAPTAPAETTVVTQVVPPEPESSAAVVDEPVAAPKKRTRRKTPVAVVVEPEPVDEDELPTEAATPVDEAPAEIPTTTTTRSPRLATTALLFQAPDPTAARPRRRRASTPAGSPEAVSEAAGAVHEELAAMASGARDAALSRNTAAQTAAGPAAELLEVEPAPAPAGRSRRSRRGSGSRAAEAVEELLDDNVLVKADPAIASDDAAEAADVDLEADEENPDADGTEADGAPRRRRRRGGRGRRSRSTADDGQDQTSGDGAETGDDDLDAESADADAETEDASDEEAGSGSSRRRRRRRRSGRGGDSEAEPTVASGSNGGRTRQPRAGNDEVTALRGSTRLEAKRQRRREGRDAGRRRTVVTESEFLARREAVDRSMVVREVNGLTQIAVLEDGVLVEHYISSQAKTSMAGNVYLGRVQNVLPSMEAAFVDVGKGRNAVLYAGEVNWDAAGMEGQPRRIEQALKSGDSVLVQVTKDPIGHKGARLTSQVTLAGRYLVYVPGGGMTGISRKLPEPERARLKKLLREIVPDSAGVIVRTAAEGASEEELRSDIDRLQAQWTAIEKKAKSASAPALLQGEPDLAIRVVRDIFNDDFRSLVVQGGEAWETVSGYIGAMAPDLAAKVSRWTGNGDVFAEHRVDEQLSKALGRKVWLPSGGSLVIDKTEAMTVIDVNTGKFVGSGGTLEETVTRNNLEAAEEIVRQLRLRDVGGIIVIDFIDMVLESNRDLVLRRLTECLGRDRTKHQVAEVTSLGLVQMTRKRVGQGLAEAFGDTVPGQEGVGGPRTEVFGSAAVDEGVEPAGDTKRARRKRGGAKESGTAGDGALTSMPVLPEAREAVKATLATIAAAAAHAHEHGHEDADKASSGGAEPVVEGSTPETVDSLSLVQVDPQVFELDGDEDEIVDTTAQSVLAVLELPAVTALPSEELDPS